MYIRILLTTSALTLAACGGGSTGPTVIPIAEAGFAGPDAEITRGDKFTFNDTKRLISDDDTLSFEDQDVVFNILEGRDEVEVTIDGQTYVLNQDNVRDFSFSEGTGIDETRISIFRLGELRPEAEVLQIFSVIDSELNTSHVVIGFDTDPAEVSARAGTAEMTGEAHFAARNLTGDRVFSDAFGDGDVTLSVDFDDNTVSGDLILSDSSDSEADFTFPTSSYRLEPADITGNGFSGTVTRTAGNIGGTLSDATYEGRFYGADAPTAGGQFTAIVTDDDDVQTFVDGGFLVSE